MSVLISQARRKRGAGGAVAPQFLAEQLTLSQPGGADYAHHSTMSPPGFSGLATALLQMVVIKNLSIQIFRASYGLA